MNRVYPIHANIFPDQKTQTIKPVFSNTKADCFSFNRFDYFLEDNCREH